MIPKQKAINVSLRYPNKRLSKSPSDNQTKAYPCLPQITNQKAIHISLRNPTKRLSMSPSETQTKGYPHLLQKHKQIGYQCSPKIAQQKATNVLHRWSNLSKFSLWLKTSCKIQGPRTGTCD